MKTTKIKISRLMLWLGIVLGSTLTALLWLDTSKQTYIHLLRISYAGITGLGLYLLVRTSRRRAFTLLALFASVSILYLFPELLGPACSGIPKAFASALRKDCRICADWNETCSNNGCHDFCVAWVWEPCDGGTIYAPTISGAVTCSQPGSNGWCRSNAQLNLTASDPQGYALTITGNAGSTPISCNGNCTINLPPGAGAVTYTVSAATSGMTGTGGTAWAYDPAPPVSNVNISGTSGSNGWYISAVNASASGSDAISGLASATLAVDGGAAVGSAVIGDGVHSVTATARDVAGNTASKILTVSVDTTPPVSVLNVSGTSGSNGWYVSAVNASASGSDAISGLASATLAVDGGAAAGTALLTDGVHSVTATARDVAGNTASKTLTISVDTLAPVIFVSAVGNQLQSGWFSTAVDLSVTASDATSGVAGGVSLSFDNGATWVNGPQTLYDGQYDVLFKALDHAGNIATSRLSLKIDTQPPHMTLSETGRLGRDGWYVSAATISAEVSDNLSGVASVQVRVAGGAWQEGDFVTVEEGIHTIDFQAFDAAGNTALVSSPEIHVDLTPPAYIFDAALNGSVLVDTVVLGGTVSDMTSAVRSVEFSSDGTTWQPVSFLDTRWDFAWDSSVFDNGQRELYLRSTDMAGNMGPPIRARIILDNDPPYVNLTETWSIWESGALTVFNNVIPLQSIRIVVRDPMQRYPDQVIYDRLPAPKAVAWDRVLGPASAPPGSYSVMVEVCDIYGLCSKDSGTIVIPIEPTPIPIQPTEPKRKWWSLPIAIPRLLVPEIEQPIAVPAVVIPIQEEVQFVPSFPTWTMIVITAFLLAFALLLLLDPRPKAWRSLTQRLAESLLTNYQISKEYQNVSRTFNRSSNLSSNRYPGGI